MNNLKKNAVGLDAVIDRLQKKMYLLASQWCIELEGYHRCYILNKNDSQTIEAYLGDNEYSKALSFAEGNKFFFVCPNDIDFVSTGYYKTSIELYFILNIRECKPNIKHRADEEVRKDVINLLERCSEVRIERIIWHIDSVFNRFKNKQSRRFIFDEQTNIQPHHSFKIELELLPYNINKQICN